MAAEQRFAVLVVDDEQTVLDTMEAVLSEHVTVSATSSPTEALRLLDTRSFHVVCADYRMPGVDGVEVLRRTSARTEYTSCLLVTGAEEYFRRQEKGGYYVLLKPFAPDRLVSIVMQLGRVAQMKRTVADMPSGRFRVAR
jgi:DNA-binding NtrC family response regulator